MDQIPIINPDSIYKLLWDTLICMISILFIVLIPIEVCVFNGIFFVQPSNIAFGIFIALQSIDLLVNLNTA
jgi:hypothetical protein